MCSIVLPSVERTLLRQFARGLWCLEQSVSQRVLPPTSFRGVSWAHDGAETLLSGVQLSRHLGSRPYDSLPAHQELTMPALSPTMETGNISKWRVKVGDSVNAGGVIADVETDKAIMGFEIQDDGVVAKLLRPEGSTAIKVGEPVCIIVEDAADVAAFKDYKPGGDAGPRAAPAEASSTSAPQSAQAAAEPRGPRSDRVGPAVRMLLADHGLTQFDVSPTGPRGIVTKGDVIAAVASGVKANESGAQAARASALTPSSAPKQAAPKPAAAPSKAAGAVAASGGGRQHKGESYTDIPNSQMRRIIAKRLLESKMTTPSIYVSQDAALASLTQLRGALKAAGIKLSVNDFVIKAAAMALRKVPGVCAGWDAQAEAAVQFDSVDISIAVATPGGLITPIVTDADSKTLTEISKAVKDLAGRARENKLQPHEFTGGSFTISNLGMFGVISFSAIINPPQACILAVGGSQHKTVLSEGRPTTVEHMTVMLSSDNRVVDEETAAEFLRVFAHNIENPGVMMVA